MEKTNRNWHSRIREIRTYPYHKSIAGGLHRTGRQEYIDNVIRNLLENALKYSDEEVEVTVTMETKEQILAVSVKDNGWGIAPQHQKSCSPNSTKFLATRINSEEIWNRLGASKYIIEEHQGR